MTITNDVWRDAPSWATDCSADINGQKLAEGLSWVNNIGYKTGTIFGKKYYQHRAIWAVVNGVWPNQIDHIDGNRANNDISNLREVSHIDNCKNKCVPSNNTSGVMGVSWHKQREKWQAAIRVDGKNISLGLFHCIKEAGKARAEAEAKYGFHKNHGRTDIAYQIMGEKE